jgi:thymidine kinase
MFSSKSSYLLKEINTYKHITNNIICINHLSDTQRTNCSAIKTHNNEMCTSLMLNKLEHLYKITEYHLADVVIIDEAQFFDDLDIFIRKEIYNKKIFIIAGLSGDINQNPMGKILNLVPLADEIIKLSALCKSCGDGTPAHFTKRKGDNKELIIIDNEKSYEPVCRKHLN